MVTQSWMSELAALTRRRPGSARAIAGFVRDHGIDLADFVQPEGGWRSFAEFFVRDFAPGARPLPDDPRLLLSPADGKLLVVGLDDDRLRLKGIDYTVDALLGDRVAAERYRGGTAVVVRLSVDDAHRFQFPASGRLLTGSSTRRRLHTVGPAGDARFLVTNSRRWRLLRTRYFGDLCLVAVGALLVGRIVLHARPRFERGDEAGVFELGGSTLVVLSEPGRVEVDADLVEASSQGIETIVRAREPIGRAL